MVLIHTELFGILMEHIMFVSFSIITITLCLIAWLIRVFYLPFVVAKNRDRSFKINYVSKEDLLSFNETEKRLHRAWKIILALSFFVFVLMIIIGFLSESVS